MATLEDLEKVIGVDNLPDFLKALENVGISLGDVATNYEEFQKQAEKAGKQVNDFAETTTEAWVKAQGGINKAVDEIKKKHRELEKSYTQLTNIGQNYIDSSPALNQLNKFTDSIKQKFSGITAQSLINAGTIAAQWIGTSKVLDNLPTPKIFENMERSGFEATSNFEYMGDLLNKIAKTGPTGEKFAGFIKPVIQATDAVKGMENAMIANMASSGQLGDLINETGEDFSGLEQKLVAFTDLTVRVGNNTGITADQVAKFATQLNMIPGALDKQITLLGEDTQQVNALEAALKLSAGTGQSAASVIDDLNQQYLKFGSSVEDNLKIISQTSDATKQLGLPLQLIKQYTRDTAEAFKFFGNESEGALKVLLKIGPALKDSKLGPEAINTLVSDITGNISRMELAQRAFLSQSTGGPGGLRGGYQIDLLKSQGKLDEVFKLTQQSLMKQFGGRVVNLDQASKSETDARQLAKQVQLVTQGPTKIVNSEQEAYKLFEAIQKGDVSGGQKLAQGDDSLRKNLEIGSNLERSQYSELIKANNYLQQVSAYTSILAKNTFRNTEKGLTDFVFGDNNEARSPFGENLDSSQTYIFDKNRTDVLPQQTVKEKLTGAINSGIDTYDELTTGKNRLQTNIDKDIQSRGTPVRTTSSPGGSREATINIETTCPECMKKIAQDQAIKIVDGEITDVKRGQILHNHAGY